MTENRLVDPHKSSLGMNGNVAVIIFWLVAAVLMIYPFSSPLAFVCPLVFLILEKESQFVKFHAMQCMIYSIIFAIINIVLAIFFFIPTVPDDTVMGAVPQMVPMVKAGFVPWLCGIVMVCIAVLVILKANTYEAYKLPIAGPIAEKQFKD